MVKRFVAFASILLLFFVSCKTKKPQPADTGTAGTIHISVDEAFKPIIEEQIQVFESAYPKAKIIAHYKPEAECWQDLLNDSTRMVIVTKNSQIMSLVIISIHWVCTQRANCWPGTQWHL